ncbi:MAG TPA: Gfo/Idh/MocA family oxidoreductase [Lacunisphaera sp.]
MFNQRTSGYYQAIHQLIHSGQLGGLQRMQWTITNWFRTQAYYASSGWRATWRGEGGGVLLNQSPHQLDLLCWMFGLPQQVRAFCHFGKYHPIEVEDEVTAYLEFPNGATGVFITSTGEAPGSNRLEIVGDLGRVVFEGDRLQFTRNTIGTAEFSKTSSNGFAAPPTEEVQLVADGHGRQHAGILQNFTEAILDGTPLLAPAEEGIQSVELANAMLLSSWLNRTIELPMNGQMFEYHLRRRMNESSSKDKRRSGRTKRAPRR